MDEIYLTKEGFEKLKGELDYLKTVRRRELSKAIGEARAHGDLSENAEYDAAKEAQALIGARVKLKDAASGEELEYTLVSGVEADFAKNKISVSSPVGKALLGHKVNETVEIKVPAGTLKYKILNISR